MFRLSGLLSLALAFCLGAILFWTSQSVQDSERQLKEKKNMLSHEEETIRVLSTEWDYLNRPQRLEELAIEGVGMEKEEAKEDIGIISDVRDIPEPITPVLPIAKPASLSRIEPAASESSEVNLPSYEKDDFEEILRGLDDASDNGGVR